MQTLRFTAAAFVAAVAVLTTSPNLQASEVTSTRHSLDTETADKLAKQPRCWIASLDNLNNKDCYKTFEEAAYVSRTNQQLYHDVGVGQGYLMPLPSCDEDGRRYNCTVVLSHGLGVQERLDYFTQYYRGIETSLRQRSDTGLIISCKNDTCSLTYL
ncbi:MAG: hypothetical protein DI628_02255 [Blastochloris viridis]|uniref:Uncharacterized protein n=1 Tax=Blastochloris viridis TaxID=1079 RepID=A0A6N4REL5_BLAVI|nr:MAG: hypothetical protein DI628_02255 [Blastochloris viridis]